MSVFCTHCHKRVILENYKLRGYHCVAEFATCGDVVVERNGYVVAPIKVGKLTIKGKVQGNVLARGAVAVDKTGSLKGDVVAPALLVELGGALIGFVRIHPATHVEIEVSVKPKPRTSKGRAGAKRTVTSPKRRPASRA